MPIHFELVSIEVFECFHGLASGHTSIYKGRNDVCQWHLSTDVQFAIVVGTP